MRTFAIAVLLLAAASVHGPLAPAPSLAQSASAPTAHNGSHDFDFLIGTWRTHYRILRHRLSNSHEWYACDGASTIKPFWGGSGNLEDGDLHCPTRYIGGMTLRLYNAGTHQWSLYWGTRKLGLVMPAQVGHFENGVGEVYAPDTYEDKHVIVRFKWELRSGDHPYFEQAFSADNGRTWEPNWTTIYTRVPSTADVDEYGSSGVLMPNR